MPSLFIPAFSLGVKKPGNQMQQTTGARCVALNQVRPFPPQRPALLAALLLRNDGVIFSVAEMDAHAAEFLVFVQSRLH